MRCEFWTYFLDLWLPKIRIEALDSEITTKELDFS